MDRLYSIDVKGGLASSSRRRFVALVLSAALGVSSRRAEARLSTGMIRSELAAMGFRCIGKVRMRGAIYEVPACLPDGRRVLLRVDPDTAKVLRVLKRD
ncbi:MAG: hypothetical protein WD673_01170 [Alphaproteobacteria bacterium]